MAAFTYLCGAVGDLFSEMHVVNLSAPYGGYGLGFETSRPRSPWPAEPPRRSDRRCAGCRIFMQATQEKAMSGVLQGLQRV